MFVYFKHEEAGKGPELARLLMSSLAACKEGAPESTREPRRFVA